ncbi:nitronate monooxygenase [Aerococcaceae bacterium DSM 109653]|uniref:Probable nitronate monooxygenase n=1 Tax=Fundicoccus ignavus TaxID=2664442 RepID=A0A6I2GXV4_9LACT|nr:nitronate monooxygenase [Fundicoccus ignavus]MRI81907.1 nitronate monooxygenase [Fundicoccus ignavus]MRI85223.1 nitronate monooxygenase [Fundicoccus ignavus]
MKTRVTELLGIDYPIIQGAMQYMSLAELAAAVSNAGGLGIVPAMAFPTTDDLRQEINKMKALTTKPFGFNISLVPEVVIPELIFDYIQVLIEEGVQIVETSGQRPAEFIKPLKDAGIKVIHKVTTVRHAKAAEADGADIISVIGMEGGGHPGSSQVAGQILWAKAAEELSVPVLAGGGIVDGKGIYAALALGVDGVLMSTRFAATPEVNASDAYREAVLSVPEYGTVLTMTSLNNAMRVANNARAQEILKAEAEGATIKELMPLISGKSNFEAMMGGRLDEAQLSVGQGIGRIDKIQTVSEVFEEIKQDFLHVHQRMNVLLS